MSSYSPQEVEADLRRRRNRISSRYPCPHFTFDLISDSSPVARSLLAAGTVRYLVRGPDGEKVGILLTFPLEHPADSIAAQAAAIRERNPQGNE